ncbi:MAG: BCD family MFS transporter [Chloroflexi bacterium]|nr:BCD family MFS transporter [Chloroflexota bacterium]
MDTQQTQVGLSLGRNLKIGLFHLGSGMTDILLNGVWNRVMVADLGVSATPVSLLLALRYFLAPIGVWAGRMSDQRLIGGFRRLFWIWLGRGLMALSVLLLGFATADLARGAPTDLPHWALIAVALLLFSLGNGLSGSTFLALLYDRSTPDQRGRVVGLVWTFLLLGFTVGGVLFAILLPSSEGEAGTAGALSFTPDMLQNLFVIAALLLGGLWFFSLLGEERRIPRAERAARTDDQPRAATETSSLRGDLRLAWSDRRTRYFFWYLGLSMLFAFVQDPILEPFGGDVFNMPGDVTTRFAAYWGTTAILGTLVFLYLSRRYAWLTNTRLNYVGVGLLLATFVAFGVAGLADLRWLVTPGLITLGLGLGLWNVGTLGLMMDMSPFGRAGTFLGFWTLVVTLARGTGVFSGGVIKDVSLALTGNVSVAYAAVFIIGAVGLGVAIYMLSHIDAASYKAENQSQPADTTTVFAGSMD